MICSLKLGAYTNPLFVISSCALIRHHRESRGSTAAGRFCIRRWRKAVCFCCIWVNFCVIVHCWLSLLFVYIWFFIKQQSPRWLLWLCLASLLISPHEELLHNYFCVLFSCGTTAYETNKQLQDLPTFDIIMFLHKTLNVNMLTVCTL